METTTAAAKLAAKLANTSTPMLAATFAHTDALDLHGMARDDAASVYVLRGALMDELENRNPAAFAAWVNSDTMDAAALRAAYGIA